MQATTLHLTNNTTKDHKCYNHDNGIFPPRSWPYCFTHNTKKTTSRRIIQRSCPTKIMDSSCITHKMKNDHKQIKMIEEFPHYDCKLVAPNTRNRKLANCNQRKWERCLPTIFANLLSQTLEVKKTFIRPQGWGNVMSASNNLDKLVMIGENWPNNARFDLQNDNNDNSIWQLKMWNPTSMRLSFKSMITLMNNNNSSVFFFV